MAEAILPGSIVTSGGSDSSSGSIHIQRNTNSITFEKNIKTADIIFGISLYSDINQMYGDRILGYKGWISYFPSTQSAPARDVYPTYAQMTPGNTYTLWGLDDLVYASNSQFNYFTNIGTINCGTNSITINNVVNVRLVIYYIVFE